MEIKKISRKSYREALEAAVELIRCRKVDIAVRHILLVPDQYTLLAEKMLYKDSFGSFDVEVLTFNRLFFKLCGEDNCLSQEGAVMLMRTLVDKNELKCFTRSHAYRGFGEKMYEIISQLMASGVAPQDIAGKGHKYDDIALVYARYLAATQGKFSDAQGRLLPLVEAVRGSNYFDNAHVYLANFDCYTVVMSRVLDEIKRRSLSLTQFDVTGVSTDTANLDSVYEAAGATEQFRHIAGMARYYFLTGCPIEDMAVVTVGSDSNMISRIFAEYGLPTSLLISRPLGSYPISDFLLLSLDCVERAFRREDVIALSKNAYINLEQEERDAFENYVNYYLINHNSFTRKFDRGDFECAERVRVKIVTILSKFADKLKRADNAQEYIAAIEFLMNSVDARSITSQLHDSDSVYDKLMSIVALLRILNNVPMSKQTELIKDAIASSEVKSLPIGGGIAVGSPSAFRGANPKHLFVADFNEGILPECKLDLALISDREIDKLGEEGVIIEPKICDINRRSIRELADLMSSAEHVHAVYLTGDVRPSGMLTAIMKHKGIKAANAITMDRIMDERSVLQLVGSRKSARRFFFERGTDFTAREELKQALGQDALLNNNDPKDLSDGYGLFFKNGKTSISQLQEYFVCPYRHFLRYGLGAKERERGELTPMDVGNFLHKVVELFVANGKFDDITEAVNAVLDSDELQGVSDKYDLDDNMTLARHVRQEAYAVCSAVAEQFKHGAFESMGQEIAFGSGKKFPKLFLGKDSCVYVTGVMDRVDACGNYIRLIDYKTGKIDFNFRDIYYGKRVQLPIYLSVLMSAGYRPAGMFYFPLSAKWGDDATSHRLKGVFDSSIEVMDMMDNQLAEVGYSNVINARLKSDGTLSANCKSGLTEQEMVDVTRYAVKVASLAVDEILDGNIMPMPLIGQSSPCEFCQFIGVCCGKREREIGKANKSDVIGAVHATE